MRLSIVGRQLDQDTMKLNEISLTEESIITLIRVHDSTMTARYVQTGSNTLDIKFLVNLVKHNLSDFMG